MNKGESVKIGVVGFGKGGRYFHAPLIDAANGCEVAAVVARSPNNRGAFVQDYPGLPIFSTITEMANVVDAVVISTPLDTHLELAREAISLGLPVVIDKPFGPNADSARAVIKETEANNVLLTVYQNRRWDADYLTVKKVLESGALGDVWLFESRMEQYSPSDGVPASGGGVLLDFGSHVMDQTLHLLGPALSVYAEIHPIPGREPLEDRFFASVLHKSGMRSHLTGDFALQGSPAPRFRLTGSKGTFAIPSHDGMADALLAGGRASTLGDKWGAVPETSWGKIERPGEAKTIPSERGAWPTFYEGFARAVRGEGKLLVSPWESLAALELLDAAKRSVASGSVIRWA
jgi:predicted dehydrogenase